NDALGAILPLADQIRDDIIEGAVENARLAGDLEEIARAARLAKRIMGGMLHYARGGSAMRTRVDLARTTSAAANLLGTRLAARRITLVQDIDPNAREVYAHQAQVERILLNLFLNALDASPEGAHITVRTRPAPSESGEPRRVVLSVEDQGAGIPVDMLA